MMQFKDQIGGLAPLSQAHYLLERHVKVGGEASPLSDMCIGEVYSNNNGFWMVCGKDRERHESHKLLSLSYGWTVFVESLDGLVGFKTDCDKFYYADI